MTKYGAVVNFVKTGNYYSVYKYVCKTDNSVYKSSNHLDLDSTGSPPTNVWQCIKQCVISNEKRRALNRTTTQQQQKKSVDYKSSLEFMSFS